MSEIENCPFCGGECAARSGYHLCYVGCQNDRCQYTACLRGTLAEAIEPHNRVARAVQAEAAIAKATGGQT